MPYCAKCGALVEGSFCAQCGTPAGGGTLPPRPLPSASGLADNVASALCYAVPIITGVLFLVLEPYNRNRTVRFHAFQALFLGLAWFLVTIVVTILLSAIHLEFFSPLVEVAFVVLWIYMIVTTYQGKTTVLPVIGPLAQQQAGTI